MDRPTIYPYPYPRTSTVSLKDRVGQLERHLRAAVAACDDEITSEDGFAAAQRELQERFIIEPLQLGDAVLDPEVGQAQRQTADPRLLGPGQRSRPIRADIHTLRIPFQGDASLLGLWPPAVSAPEPSPRNWHDPRDGTLCIPADEDPFDRGGVKRHLQEQEEIIRKLVEATNKRVAEWNGSLEESVSSCLDQRRFALRERSGLRESLGYPIQPASGRPIPYRLPRQPSRPPRVVTLEAGDYPILADEDLAEVMQVIRKWAQVTAEHPSTVRDRDEEELRDLLLTFLNGSWPTTAEAFSRRGKTDVRVVVDQSDEMTGSAVVFKAECKIYRDAGDVSDAYEQLADRYLTQRENKGALILFVPNPKLYRLVRQRAVDRLVSRHGGEEQGEVAGWPLVALPHKDDPERTMQVVVAIIDVAPARNPADQG